jgi:putative endonuclease
MAGVFYFQYVLHLYIISPSKNKYYVGSAANALTQRIKKHNTNHSAFTGKTGDWELKYFEKFNSKTEALKREKQIKRLIRFIFIVIYVSPIGFSFRYLFSSFFSVFKVQSYLIQCRYKYYDNYPLPIIF